MPCEGSYLSWRPVQLRTVLGTWYLIMLSNDIPVQEMATSEGINTSSIGSTFAPRLSPRASLTCTKLEKPDPDISSFSALGGSKVPLPSIRPHLLVPDLHLAL